MNSKGEWNGSRLPRVRIERGEVIENEENDLDNRMMNWDSRDQKKGWMKYSEKRKSDKIETENEVGDDEIKAPRKKKLRRNEDRDFTPGRKEVSKMKYNHLA